MIADSVYYVVQYLGDAVDSGDYTCWVRTDIATDCSPCPTLEYPAHGGAIEADLTSGLLLDGTVDGACRPVPSLRCSLQSGCGSCSMLVCSLTLPHPLCRRHPGRSVQHDAQRDRHVRPLLRESVLLRRWKRP